MSATVPAGAQTPAKAVAQAHAEAAQAHVALSARAIAIPPAMEIASTHASIYVTAHVMEAAKIIAIDKCSILISDIKSRTLQHISLPVTSLYIL